MMLFTLLLMMMMLLSCTFLIFGVGRAPDLSRKAQNVVSEFQSTTNLRTEIEFNLITQQRLRSFLCKLANFAFYCVVLINLVVVDLSFICI